MTDRAEVARRLWERIGFLALSQPVVYEREINLMKIAQRAQGRDTDLLDAKRKTLAQIAESEAREAVSMLEHALLAQRQAGRDEGYKEGATFMAELTDLLPPLCEEHGCLKPVRESKP